MTVFNKIADVKMFRRAVNDGMYHLGTECTVLALTPLGCTPHGTLTVVALGSCKTSNAAQLRRVILTVGWVRIVVVSSTSPTA